MCGARLSSEGVRLHAAGWWPRGWRRHRCEQRLGACGRSRQLATPVATPSVAATPLDPAQNGLYVLFSPAGEHLLTASFAPYVDQAAAVNVVGGNTVRHDFALTAGKLVAVPTQLDARLELGQTQVQMLDLQNLGSAAANFAIAEFRRQPSVSGPFEKPSHGVAKPFRQHFKTAQNIRVPRILPPTPLLWRPATPFRAGRQRQIRSRGGSPLILGAARSGLARVGGTMR